MPFGWSCSCSCLRACELLCFLLLRLFGGPVQPGNLAETLLATALPEFTCGQLSAGSRLRNFLALGGTFLGFPGRRGQIQLEVELLNIATLFLLLPGIWQHRIVTVQPVIVLEDLSLLDRFVLALEIP